MRKSNELSEDRVKAVRAKLLAIHDERRTDGPPPWPPSWAMYGAMWEERDKAVREATRLRAELAEARNAASEALGCRFIHDKCDCGDTVACGVCHMVERLRLLRDGEGA